MGSSGVKPPDSMASRWAPRADLKSRANGPWKETSLMISNGYLTMVVLAIPALTFSVWRSHFVLLVGGVSVCWNSSEAYRSDKRVNVRPLGRNWTPTVSEC